jgi:hypothetical protein
LHLLYVDESGHSHDPSSDFFVLAGFSIFERQSHWLESQIDPIAKRFSATDPESIEFHGAPMRAGKYEWKGVAPADRVQAVVDILAMLADTRLQLQVFASVIEKSQLPVNNIVHQSFEDVASRFDQYLGDLFRRRHDAQRGLMICDKSSYEETLQELSHLFKHQGHANGRLRNFAEVPLFLNSKASRLIQMADMIGYWIFRYCQSDDDRGYKLIQPYFCRFGYNQSGLITRVSQAMETRLVNLPVAKDPFPDPSRYPRFQKVP